MNGSGMMIQLRIVNLTFFSIILLNCNVSSHYGDLQLSEEAPRCSGMSSFGLMGEGAAIMAIVCRGGVVDWFCRRL